LPVERLLGKRCWYAETCRLFHGIEIPENQLPTSKFDMKTVYLRDIENPKEKEILQLLKTGGACLYGEIFKQLSISSSEGQHLIFSLLSRGLIKYQYRSSNIELNVELK
jgi:hypothetical protein